MTPADPAEWVWCQLYTNSHQLSLALADRLLVLPADRLVAENERRIFVRLTAEQLTLALLISDDQYSIRPLTSSAALTVVTIWHGQQLGWDNCDSPTWGTI